MHCISIEIKASELGVLVWTVHSALPSGLVAMSVCNDDVVVDESLQIACKDSS